MTLPKPLDLDDTEILDWYTENPISISYDPCSNEWILRDYYIFPIVSKSLRTIVCQAAAINAINAIEEQL